MAEPLLSYDHVSVAYEGRVVVHDVSFAVAAGETLGIVGESGSGKSTLLRAALRLGGPAQVVVQGRILYRGNDLAQRDERGMRDVRGREIGMVFQDCLAALTPIRTIGDQAFEVVAAHGPATRADVDARLGDLLARLAIADPARVLASYPFELSGGMGQRVGIALALIMEPAVLLADEPTSALDAVTQKQVVEELGRLCRETGAALVVVSHNIGVIRALADDVLVLKDGAVVERGRAAEVLSRPQDAYTRELLAAAPSFKGVRR